MRLFDTLLDDAAMFPPGNAPAARAVAEHVGYRSSWFGGLVDGLVVPDTALAEVSRQVPAGLVLDVRVVTSGGAGGLVALSGRTLPGVEVHAAEVTLRDLDDLAGAAHRVAAAAGELDEVEVYVEIPYAPGWIQAVGVVEAAGLCGKIRTGGPDPAAYPSADQLAEQLSVLVEADLAFKATAGLHRAWPTVVADPGGQSVSQHGFLNLLLAVEALIDGAEVVEAADLLQTSDRRRLATAVAGWDDSTVDRVRRRFRSFGCCGVTDPVADLVALGLVSESA